MSQYNAVENFVSFLKGEPYQEFLSDDFIAIRDYKGNQYKEKDSVMNHYAEFESKTNVSYEKEDSHYLISFSSRDISYIVKAKLDGNFLIESLVEDIRNDLLNQVVLTIEYDGKAYYGMQKQNETKLPSVQSELELALKRMLNKDVVVTISSRTDKGVHALGQKVQFDASGIDPSRYMYALNNLLPEDIRIKDAALKSQLFNCRYDTVKKTYHYIVDTNEYSVFRKDYVWFTRVNDLSFINEELKSLLGTHDFISFCKGENDNTVRTIYEAIAEEKDGIITFTFTGSGFLHNMIRFIMGSLLEIDKTHKTTMKELIDSKDKNLTVKLAPASGLYLMNIEY